MGTNYSEIRTIDELQSAIDALRIEKNGRRAALGRLFSESQKQLRPSRIIKETLQSSASGFRWSSVALSAFYALRLGLRLFGGRKARLRKVTE